MCQIGRKEEFLVRGKALVEKVPLVCFTATIVISLIALIGWTTGFLVLSRTSERFIPMAPSTALSFIGLSGALLLHRAYPARPPVNVVVRGAALAVMLFCLSIAVEISTGLPLGIEKIFYRSPQMFGTVALGRMSLITASCFIASGMSLLLLASLPADSRRGKSMAAGLALIVVLVAAVHVLGYSYGTLILYGGKIIPIALNTAVAFLFLGIGQVVLAGPQSWLSRQFAGASTRALLMRSFVPVTIMMIIINRWIGTTIFAHVVNPALTVSLLSVLSIFVVLLVSSKIAIVIGERIDRAEEELSRTNHELKDALATIKTLQGILPICSSCKKIRDEKGHWNQIELYISEHSGAEFSHGLCPECLVKLYPSYYNADKKKQGGEGGE